MGSYVLQQIGYSSPLLLVYLVGIILSIIYVRKYPMPAMLTLAACVILSVNLLAIAIIQGYLIIARVESGWSGTEYSQITMVVSAIGAVVRALGSALLIAAIFLGRRPKSSLT